MTKRMANPRSPAVVLADLAECERMIRECRARYSHAYDLAYSSGSGGDGRTAITESRPTEAAALSPGKDGSRAHVARAGKEAKRMVDAAHEMHSSLVRAMPGSDPYEQTWKPSPDGIATRAERAESLQRQADRIARGDL